MVILYSNPHWRACHTQRLHHENLVCVRERGAVDGAEQLDLADEDGEALRGIAEQREQEMREYCRKMQLRVVWSAPYSYAAASIELLFAGLKFGQLNPSKLPTGKKVSLFFF